MTVSKIVGYVLHIFMYQGLSMTEGPILHVLAISNHYYNGCITCIRAVLVRDSEGATLKILSTNLHNQLGVNFVLECNHKVLLKICAFKLGCSSSKKRVCASMHGTVRVLVCASL